jgi:hypothetical protein
MIDLFQIVGAVGMLGGMGGAMFGLFAALATHSVPVGLSFLCGFATVPSGAIGTWGIVTKFQRRSAFKKTRRIPRAGRFDITSPDGVQLKCNPNLVAKESWEDGPIAISLDQVCKEPDVCRFNPLQLAYLGHVDLLQSENLAAVVRSILVNSGLTTGFQELRVAAEALRQDPSSYRKQATFLQTVLKMVQVPESNEQRLRDGLQNLVTKIEEIKKQLVEVRNKLYRFSVPQFSEELMLKNEIIMIRLQTDLMSLTDVQSHQEEILARFEGLRPILARLSKAIVNEYQPPEVWKENASDVLMALGEFELIPQH